MSGRRWRGYLAAAAVAVVLLWIGLPQIPPRWNPWAPIRLAEAPGFLTSFKLQNLRDDPAACRAILDAAGFVYRDLPDQVTGPGCGFHDAVRIERSAVAYGGGFAATCPLAAGLALFERHVLQPAAQAAFGESVVAVDHLGSYACRNMNNRNAGRRSQHATANALDIAGVVLADGARVTLTQDWDGGGAKAAFLHRLHDDGCAIFSVVLGPDHDAAHRSHLHVDLGGLTYCR